MADKLRLGNEVRQLKIGQSFTNPQSAAFHSIKYDFKPASVDTNKIATVDVGSNHQVTVTVPHLDGAGVPQTVFKGSQRPYQKECVLVIDRVTGEITLEKLACNIQVKKTRSESMKLQLPQERQPNDKSSSTSTGSGSGCGGSGSGSSSNLATRAQTPPVGGGQRISHKTKVTSGSRRADRPITHLVPKHSPLHASPNYPSPNHHNNKSPKEVVNNPSTLASLPMIGMDDFSDPAPPVAISTATTTMSSSAPSVQPLPVVPPQIVEKSPVFALSDDNETGAIGEITDSSSSSSDSDSDSDPDNVTVVPAHRTNGHGGGGGTTSQPTMNGSSSANKMPTQLLNHDLCLSESGSDSD